MIKWPKRALNAIVKLFEPLQDIDVFVEDVYDEVFYRRLLTRVTENKIHIARVFSKGGRAAVINAAKSHDKTKRRALFIIDGDFEWVTGRSSRRKIPSLYRLDAYCIENLLICEKAAANILSEETVLSEEDAYLRLNFASWVANFKEPLVNLFAAFATVYFYKLSYATVSRGVGRLCTETSSGQRRLDNRKIETEREKTLTEVVKVVGKKKTNKLYEKIRQSANALPCPFDIVSGKDFLLPLLDFLLQSLGCRVKRKSLRLKLALHCNLERFSGLKAAVERAARDK